MFSKETSLIVLASAILFLCAGCRSVAEDDYPNDDGDAGEDVGTDGDADSDGDTDTDTDADGDTDADSDTGADDFSNPCYAVGSSGCLFLSFHRYAPDGYNFTADAQFYDITEAPVDYPNTETIIEAEGVDTCSLVFEDGTGSGSEGVMEYLGAGAVTLTSGAESADLDMYSDDYFTSYSADLGGLGLEPRFEEGYSLFASGDEAPALVLDPAVTLPAEMTVIAPEPGSVLPHAPVVIAWGGANGAHDAVIEISVHETYPSWSEQYVVDCVVHDDGAFEIPGAVMEALPAGWYASFGIHRRTITAAPYADATFFSIATVSATSLFTIGE
jgi:hypothetical protein